MDRNHPSSANLLPSGSYVIWSPTGDSFMSAENLRWGEKIVVTERTLPVRWDVVFHVDQRGYTIQIPERQSFIVTDDAKIVVTSDKQFFDIIPQTKDNHVYYLIRSQSDKSLLQYNGLNKEVTAKKGPASSSFWVFREFSAAIQPASPYSVYSKNSDYFVYSATERFLDRFGLIPTYTWPKFWDEIQRINEEDQSSAIYKVIFFARHGNAFNNLRDRKELENHEDQIDDGTEIDEYDSLELDANLSQEGFLQVLNAQALWKRENSLEEGIIGIPEISYCSPLTRCMVTNSITFAPQLSHTVPRINTLIVSDLREIYYNEGERPRSKDYINLVFPKFSTEGYTDPDIPSSQEPSDSAQRRARAVLDKLFTTESEDKIFVSITSHSGILKDIISILGVDPGAFPLQHTHAFSLLSYTPSSNVLDDGYYKIEHVPNDPNSQSLSKFADAVGQGRPVEVFKSNSKTPTTWYAKCVDKDQQYYSIEYFDEYSSRGPNLYWNKSEKKSVILTDAQKVWRVVSAGNDGDYCIESVGNVQPFERVEVRDKANDGDSLKLSGPIGNLSPRWKFIPVDFTSSSKFDN